MKPRRNYVDGCRPCPKCYSEKLIPHIYMSDPTTVKIHCHECGFDGEEAEETKDAILKWNKVKRA